MTTPVDPDYHAAHLFNESEETKQSERFRTYKRCRKILETQYDTERLQDRLLRLIVKLFYDRDMTNIKDAKKIVKNLPIPLAIATKESWLNTYDGKIESDDYSNDCFEWAIGLVNQNKITFDTCVKAFTLYDKGHFEEVVTAHIRIKEQEHRLRYTIPNRKRVAKTIEEINRHEEEQREEVKRIKKQINKLTARLNELHM